MEWSVGVLEWSVGVLEWSVGVLECIGMEFNDYNYTKIVSFT